MSNIPSADLLAGDEIISAEEVLQPDDPVFDPKTRPDINTALHPHLGGKPRKQIGRSGKARCAAENSEPN